MSECTDMRLLAYRKTSAYVICLQMRQQILALHTVHETMQKMTFFKASDLDTYELLWENFGPFLVHF